MTPPKTDTLYREGLYMRNYRQELKKCNLTERQMRCLAMWYFDGLTLRKIAEVLGIDWTTVREHVQRGQRKLKAAGLKPKRRYMEHQPKLLVRDNEYLDNLGPDEIRAVW